MSWHPQHDNGAYGASGANGAYDANQVSFADGAPGVYAGNVPYQDGGGTQGLPVVYHPYGDRPQAYDGYGDPATAHGWQGPAATGHGVAPGDAYRHPQGAYVDRHDAYEGGFGTQAGAHGTDETDYGAYGTEHEHIYRDEGRTYGSNDDQDDAGHDDGSVFVDASGRRSQLIRRAAFAVAAVCFVFLAVVIAGFFSSVPSGGSLPWSQEQNQKHNQEQDGPTKTTDQPGSNDGPTADPSVTPGESAVPSPSASAAKTGGETEEPATEAPTTTAASTTSAPGKGNSGDNPGRGQGSTRGPR